MGVDAASTTRNDACLIIPMFNESAVIANVVKEACAVFEHVICIDDGSTDDSAALALAGGATVVRHLFNLGQGAALQTGLSFALSMTNVEWLVTYDADGQHRLEDAIRMVDYAKSANVDLVLGSRFLTPSTAVPRNRRLLLATAVRFTRWTTRLAVTDTHNGLRVLNREAAAMIRMRLSGMAHASELLEQVARLGFRYHELPVSIRYTDYSRGKGQKGINSVNILFDLLLNRIRASV